MRTIVLALSLSLVMGGLTLACSHDDKPAAMSPDVAMADAGGAVVVPVETEAGASNHACDAVRCKGGMVCKIVDGKPTCVTQ